MLLLINLNLFSQFIINLNLFSQFIIAINFNHIVKKNLIYKFQKTIKNCQSSSSSIERAESGVQGQQEDSRPDMFRTGNTR